LIPSLDITSQTDYRITSNLDLFFNDRRNSPLIAIFNIAVVSYQFGGALRAPWLTSHRPGSAQGRAGRHPDGRP
jgi:hypothetical protein